jgi:rsbT co-antagonist protein RsbR
MTIVSSRLGELILTHQSDLLDGWLASLLARLGRRDAGTETELRQQASRFLSLLGRALQETGAGDIDSARTQVVMESLLEKIVETGASIAIVDITGVPTVDTLVAQHLLKTVAAARLMGADCIMSGIRPQIAQTIVHLGVNLEDVTTKATLADAFRIALKRTGSTISSSAARE